MLFSINTLIFKFTYKLSVVCNLVAQNAVRYSLENPRAYAETNFFFNVFDASREHIVNHYVYTNSFSVYGLNEHFLLEESVLLDLPAFLYAETKRFHELMTHAYSHVYNLPTTGLRFFTVYGPWGRPDMAVIKFTKAI